LSASAAAWGHVVNAAGTGARLALISQERRLTVALIAARDGYIEPACCILQQQIRRRQFHVLVRAAGSLNHPF
jgi:hypothetical protein